MLRFITFLIFCGESISVSISILKNIIKTQHFAVKYTFNILNNQNYKLTTTELSDIINGCKKLDQLMQKQLYLLCYKEMMKVCFRYTNDIETSASMYNDAMIKVFKNIKVYTEEGKINAWIKRIVINTCIDHLRKKIPLETKLLHEDFIDNTQIENGVIAKMTNADIKAIINKLPKNAALIFNLYVYEEYNHTEIAELLKIPGGTSRYYLSEARRLLKKEIDNNIYSLNKI